MRGESGAQVGNQRAACPEQAGGLVRKSVGLVKNRKGASENDPPRRSGCLSLRM